MKAIAINLPQFHEVELNNKWWGKGFTDWVKVKAAQPMFKDHKQPKVPLGKNYYDLTQKETMIYQTELMKRGNVYGLAYYHYWYYDQPVLGQPLENLLKWTEIDQKFLLYWGNCDWFYSRPTSNQRKMIMRQEYGMEPQWKIHMDYLLRFFKDPRYITIDNKPVLCIYRPGEIANIDAMIEFFRKEVKEAGFAGLYIIETLFNYGEDAYCEGADAVMFREPNCVKKLGTPQWKDGICFDPHFWEKGIGSSVKCYQYDELARLSVKNQFLAKKSRKFYAGLFTGWDNTPRHGYKGYVIENPSPESFESYVAAIQNELEDPDDFVFINAWNEWGEGMYLEPCEEFGYGFLDALKKGMKNPRPLPKEDYLSRIIEDLSQFDQVFLYGAGVYGRSTLAFLKEYLPDFQTKVRGFLDDTPEKIGTDLDGVAIFSRDTIQENNENCGYLVCSDERSHEIMKQKLLESGAAEKQILFPEIAFLDFKKDRDFIKKCKAEFLALSEMLADDRSRQVLQNILEYHLYHRPQLLEEIADGIEKRYFDEDLLKGQGKGTYLDCGSYIGDTLKEYVRYSGDPAANMICCEPNKENVLKIREVIEENAFINTSIREVGVWNKEGTMLFECAGEKSGYISDTGNVKIDVDTIDRVVGDRALDFLKIEVDGAEYEALTGAVEVIRREQPVVAISVYHQMENILRIPFLLKGYNFDYKIYLRHYGQKTLTDTICYALPEKRGIHHDVICSDL